MTISHSVQMQVDCAGSEHGSNDGWLELQATFGEAYSRVRAQVPESSLDHILCPIRPSKPSKQRTSSLQATSNPLRKRAKAVLRNVKSAPGHGKAVALRRESGLRQMLQEHNLGLGDFDTRSPAWEKKTEYDSLLDEHCRVVVKNPGFKQNLLRTRPEHDHLLTHRMMTENTTAEECVWKSMRGVDCTRQEAGDMHAKVVTPKASGGAKLQPNKPKRKKNTSDVESWRDTVKRLIEGEVVADEASQVVDQYGAGAKSGGEPDHGDGGGGGDCGGDASVEVEVEKDRQTLHKWAMARFERLFGDIDDDHTEIRLAASAKAKVSDDPDDSKPETKADAFESRFGSLNSVMMCGDQVDAGRVLNEELEKVWAHVKAPEKELRHVRKTYCSAKASVTTLTHLYYQVSRWREYQKEVVKACEIIYRREMLLLDLEDNLQDDPDITQKIADFFAASHEAIQHVTAVKNSFPGMGSGCLLLNYIPKVRNDIANIRKLAPSGAVAGGGNAHTDTRSWLTAPVEAEMSSAQRQLLQEASLKTLSQASVGLQWHSQSTDIATSRPPEYADYTQYKVKLAAELGLFPSPAPQHFSLSLLHTNPSQTPPHHLHTCAASPTTLRGA